MGGTNFGKAVGLLSGGRFLFWLSWPRPKRAGRLRSGEAMPGHPQAGTPHTDTLQLVYCQEAAQSPAARGGWV